MSVNVVKQTKLWIIAEKRLKPCDLLMIENACNQAEDILTRIPDTFPTYTLHDATHSKNVCDIMFELLGNQVDKLTEMEVAFLILSAFYHDTGMVYIEEEKSNLLDSQEFSSFRKNYRYMNDKIKANNGNVPNDIAECFFRTIHAQRMEYVPDLVIGNVPIRKELAALCKSHGSGVAKLLSDEYSDLTDFDRESVDLVFCAILLRLADILDFDKSRSPEILYEYLKLKDADTKRFEASKKEFLKHKESLGFIFPREKKDGYKIRFNAQCESIEIEHDIRSFLDVINRELKECANLLSKYKTRLDKLILPISIDLKDSYGTNYQYGQYMFTVEQDKAFKLFTGENLYSDKSVFVRELLQNAIDTVLHRQLYEKHYREISDELAVNITTWTDAEHYQWIRVDDDGMGMNEERIRKYFLKAGESFYTSVDFADEISLYKEKGVGSFTPISRFGIGVLSCFLAGDKVEVSTLAHGSKSVRLSMSAGKKYFTTQLEEKGHKADPMPTRSGGKSTGYRNKCGTSIAVRVAPYQHFEDLNFKEIIKKYILYPPIPVYLNGIPFITEREFLDTVNKVNVLEFPISKLVIEKIKKEQRVSIHSGASIKVCFLNLSKYVSETNREQLKGGLFLVRGCQLSYTDDFYEKNNIKDERAKVKLKVGIVNNRVKLILNRDSYFEGVEELPAKEQKWFSMLYSRRSFHSISYDSSEITKAKGSDLGIDLNSYDWYRIHLSHLVDDEDYSRLMPRYSHNGISYFYGNGYRTYSAESLPIILSHDTFRPELSVSREEIKALPLEMNSEVNLAIRKAIDEFSLQAETDLNHAELIDEDFINFATDRGKAFSPSLVTADEICALCNFDSDNSWHTYYSLHGSEFCLVDDTSILRPQTLPGVIYGTLIQKYKQCKLVKNEDEEYELVIDSLSVENNDIIFNYYPPLFFIHVDNEDSLFVRYRLRRGLINLNNPESKRIIANTEALYNKYPALFIAFVNTVYNGHTSDFDNLFQKIKNLPLWQNS